MQQKIAAPGSANRTVVPKNHKKKQQTRNRIFIAAIELVAEHGLANVTVEQITERADVGKGTFFNYFPNKEAVLTYFGAVQVERLKAARDSGEIRGTARQRLERMLCLLGENPMITPELARGLFISALSMNPVTQFHGPSIWGTQELLAEVIREGQEKGEFSAAQPADQVALFMLGQHLLALLTWCTGFSTRPLLETIEYYVATSLDGLAP